MKFLRRKKIDNVAIFDDLNVFQSVEFSVGGGAEASEEFSVPGFKFEVTEEGADSSDGMKEEQRKYKYRYGAQVAAKPNNNCKVCKYFESHPKKLRGTKTLFAKHYGIGPGGCPRFVELDISMRREIVKVMQCLEVIKN